MENKDPNISKNESNIFRSVKDIQKLKRDAQKLNEEASAYEFGFEKTSKTLIPAKNPRLHKGLIIRSQKKGQLKDRFIETDNITNKTSLPSNEPVVFGPSNEPVFNVPSNEPPNKALSLGPSNEPDVDGACSTKSTFIDNLEEATSTEDLSNVHISSNSTLTFISQENVQGNMYAPISESSMDAITFELDETQDDDRQLIEIMSEEKMETDEQDECGSILFRKGLGFFEIVEAKDKQIIAKCLSCESLKKKGKVNFKGVRGISSNFLKHLKVTILSKYK